MRNLSVFNRNQGVAIGIAAAAMLALAWVRGIFSVTSEPLTWTLAAVAVAGLATTLATARSATAPRLGAAGQLALYAVVWGGFAASSMYAGLVFHDNSLFLYGVVFAAMGALSAAATIYFQRDRNDTEQGGAGQETPKPSSVAQVAALVGASVSMAVMINRKGAILDSPMSIGAALITLALVVIAASVEHKRELRGHKRELTPQQSLLLLGALFAPTVLLAIDLGSYWKAASSVVIGLFSWAVVSLSRRRN